MSSDGPADPDALAGLSSLDDPVRRRLYDHVVSRDGPVSRDDAATALGIGRTLVAYHLDKLAEVGLLATTYQRAAGRGGPGGGRPAKLYRPAEREFAVSVPPRAYELLARLLVESVEKDQSGTVRTTLHDVARDTGERIVAASGRNLVTALRNCGYQPRAADDGTLELRNCPFHRLATDHRDLVCDLNLRLVEAVVDGSRRRRAHAVLEPRPGRCCVVVREA